MTIKLQEKFHQYHQDNPQIYKAFERYAIIATFHRKHFGAKNIMEQVRWNTMVSGDDEFKVNNNYCAYYARLFESAHPEHKGFFRMRSIL